MDGESNLSSPSSSSDLCDSTNNKHKLNDNKNTEVPQLCHQKLFPGDFVHKNAEPCANSSANVTTNQCEHREQNTASQYNGNEQCGDGPYNICMCCYNKFRDCKCLKFLEHSYDLSKNVVERALSFIFKKQDMATFICNFVLQTCT